MSAYTYKDDVVNIRNEKMKPGNYLQRKMLRVVWYQTELIIAYRGYKAYASARQDEYLIAPKLLSLLPHFR